MDEARFYVNQNLIFQHLNRNRQIFMWLRNRGKSDKKWKAQKCKQWVKVKPKLVSAPA